MTGIISTDDKTIDAFEIKAPAVVLKIHAGFGLEPTYIGGRTVVKIEKNEHRFSVEAEDEECRKKLTVTFGGLTSLIENYKKTGEVVTTRMRIDRSDDSIVYRLSQKHNPPLEAEEAGETRAEAKKRFTAIYKAVQQLVRPYVA